MVAENPQLCILQFFFSSCFPWSMMLLSRLFFFFQGKGEEGLRLPFLCVRIFFFFFFLRFCPEPQLLCCGFLRRLCCTINQSISQLCEPNTSLWSALWHSVKEMRKLEAKGSSAHDPLFACLLSLQHTACRVHSVKARATAIKKG